MTVSRRSLIASALAGGAVLAGKRAQAKTPPDQPTGEPPATGPHHVVVPNGAVLPSSVKRGVRIFHLRAEQFDHEIAPGLTIKAWGYNKSTPGPLIEATEGEKVRIYVTNDLPEPTTIHWHGVFVPYGMDGVGGLTQPPIPAGKTFKYEFTFDRAGTFMYHPHVDEMTQIALGMMGMIVVHPRGGERARVRDYALMAHEMYVPIGARRADPLAMIDFNVLTFNGKSFPATESLTAEIGDRVRIRIGNLGPMDHHPIHLHGHDFWILGQATGIFDLSTSTLNLINPPRRDVASLPANGYLAIAFKKDNPGSWLLHCHIAWHASQGLAMQFVESEDDIAISLTDTDIFEDTCAAWNAYTPTELYLQGDSGI